MTRKQPITVADLIERLQQCDPAAVVMIECEDSYYSGAVDLDDIALGEAGVLAPYDYEMPKEAPWFGRKRHDPGGQWVIVDEHTQLTGGRQRCVIIHAG